MADPRAERQLALIEEMTRALDAADVPFWLRGGWALDFLVGRITRDHADIDVLAHAHDAERVSAVLESFEYAPVAGPLPERQRNFKKAGEKLHVALLETDQSGELFLATFRDLSWPRGTLLHPRGRIGDLSPPIISPEAQLWAKDELRRFLGDPERAHDAADIELLRAFVNR